MTGDDFYAARRTRSTSAEMEARYAALVSIVQETAPTSVRHVYYRAVVAGVVEKTGNGYLKVQRALVTLRNDGRVDRQHIVDNTRLMRKPVTWESADDALDDLAASYRRAMWQDLPVRAELWCESDSVAGVLQPVVDEYDVPCFPIRGQTSDSFCYSVAQDYGRTDRQVRLLYVGDFDPAGLEIQSQLDHKLREFSGRNDLRLHRVGVTAEQAADLQDLGTVPKKTTWRSATGVRSPFPGLAIEAEAMPPQQMRDRVTAEIRALIPPRVLHAHEVVERQEREFLSGLPQFSAWP